MTVVLPLPANPVALEKEAQLRAWMEERGSALLGYSGGVDSAYLACVGTAWLGVDRFLAVIGRSASYPAEQWEHARRLAATFGIPVREVETQELDDANYAANPVNRCFFCKTELWRHLVPLSVERGLSTVIDGTNADDLGGHRPGTAAARAAGVRSPLAELGFTKDEIRTLSRARGIASWSRPSSPCLSSRIPYGLAVTPARLALVERAEAALRALGVRGDLRVRCHDDLARIELNADELVRWTDVVRLAAMCEAVRAAGFARVAVDAHGFRSGSLNVLSGVPPT
jgi:pyridinium-3,5-biscarboxylic acid mononucleotide sulfurtransferase